MTNLATICLELFRGLFEQWHRDTSQHADRTTQIALAIGRRMGMSKEDMGLLRAAAFMHDAGKVRLPPSIRDAPRPLTEAELEEVRLHPAAGEDIVNRLDGSEEVARIVRQHHERIDGTGYPDALVGKEVAVIASAISVADIYEALTDDRPYRAAMTHEEAMEMMSTDAHRRFHPEVWKAFCEVIKSSPLRGIKKGN